MNLVQAIVRLLCRTKMYIAFPRIIEQFLILIANHPEGVPDKELFKTIEEITSERFGQMPFIPNESGGFVLTKTIATGEWNLVKLPSKINLETHLIYGQYGDRHSIRILETGEIIALVMAKVSGDRIYASDPSEIPQDDKARSIVYENIMSDNITITTKNVNLTFFNCRRLVIDLNECPVGGIKIVKCNNCRIRISEGDKSPVIPIYAFYCVDCKIELPKNYGGYVKQEIYECMDFNIL